VARREQTSDPAFGSDSFLDVTANLVGVLIILIVLVGLRVVKAPPPPAAVEAEMTRRIDAATSRVNDLARERLDLERQLTNFGQGLAAKQTALVSMAQPSRERSATADVVAEQLAAEQRSLRSHAVELANARDRLVSLERELADSKGATVHTAEKLVHQSPLSRPVELEEIHLELQSGRVTFIDTPRLIRWAGDRLRSRQLDFRAAGQSTGEVGPVGSYSVRFSVLRKEMSYSQAMLSESPAQSVKLEFIPKHDPRGEPTDRAVQPDSELARLLDRHSPNKFAVTIWTYPDSFLAFRQLRDYLSDRGYVVAARPKRFGDLITFATEGTRSAAQ
jgi:hypothetical protein